MVEEVEEEEEGGEGEGEEGGVDGVVAVDAGSYGYLQAEAGDTTSMMTTKTGGQNHLFSYSSSSGSCGLLLVGQCQNLQQL